MKKILIVVGTRPNFIKITQFKKVNAQMGMPFDIKIVHTGQHYDSKMADVFFEQFELTPDFWLNIPHGTPNSQMAEIMLRLEKVMLEYKPDLLMVVGDVNSTFAAALTANKMNTKIAHIESGLRSNDRTMPEEINRILTDAITDYFFITEDSGQENLILEGKKAQQLFFVGNTMIDTLVAFDHKIQESDILSKLNIREKEFVLMTMHRPATVDFKDGLENLFSIIRLITKNHKLVFPIHPRTMHRIEEFGLKNEIVNNDKLILTEPLDYFAFQKLIHDCAYIVTDSGGIQEESTFRRIPCLTLRANTERPSTVEVGTNELVPFDIKTIGKKINAITNGKYKKGTVPPMWDGKSTQRILENCLKIFDQKLKTSPLTS
ncbi:MAG: UDP-N-acetylglucosamine 2-epimerase (non-hydrolyzing) [Bacteroidetes bacterium]|jgi:UDP-N-acetylglucosamine 2-epimerase (non-hydrolysing)|nr:UDP-N-acetylglucosamine 2-epimerase (non-hydrolyzing) [Bacteroidota bacterium]